MKAAVLVCSLALIVSGCSGSVDSDIKKLESEDPVDRLMAQNALVARRGDPETVKMVIGLLDGEKERSVFLAAQVLGEMRDTTAVGPLVNLANRPEQNLRSEAVLSLGKISSPSGVPVIVRALADTSALVRKSAVTALGELRALPELNTIRGMLMDRSPSVRAAVVQALYQFSDAPGSGVTASDFQLAMQDSFDIVRYVAAQALGKEYPDADITEALLVRALDDPDTRVRTEAVRSLGKIGCVRAVPILKKKHGYVPYEEQVVISETIRILTGEAFPAR